MSERCEIFSGLRLRLQPIHNVQANMPIENVVAIIDAVMEFNGRPSASQS